VRDFATDDLDAALERARSEREFETAVFMEAAAGGFLYWTSKHPEVFNSSVLEIE